MNCSNRDDGEEREGPADEEWNTKKVAASTKNSTMATVTQRKQTTGATTETSKTPTQTRRSCRNSPSCSSTTSLSSSLPPGHSRSNSHSDGCVRTPVRNTPDNQCGTLVWVAMGRLGVQHPAFLLSDRMERRSSLSSSPSQWISRSSAASDLKAGEEETTKVRWASTGAVERVPTQAIFANLTPRKRNCRSLDGKTVVDSFLSSSYSSSRRSRLSLSKRRQNRIGLSAAGSKKGMGGERLAIAPGDSPAHNTSTGTQKPSADDETFDLDTNETRKSFSRTAPLPGTDASISTHTSAWHRGSRLRPRPEGSLKARKPLREGDKGDECEDGGEEDRFGSSSDGRSLSSSDDGERKEDDSDYGVDEDDDDERGDEDDGEEEGQDVAPRKPNFDARQIDEKNFTGLRTAFAFWGDDSRRRKLCQKTSTIEEASLDRLRPCAGKQRKPWYPIFQSLGRGPSTFSETLNENVISVLPPASGEDMAIAANDYPTGDSDCCIVVPPPSKREAEKNLSWSVGRASNTIDAGGGNRVGSPGLGDDENGGGDNAFLRELRSVDDAKIQNSTMAIADTAEAAISDDEMPTALSVEARGAVACGEGPVRMAVARPGFADDTGCEDNAPALLPRFFTPVLQEKRGLPSREGVIEEIRVEAANENRRLPRPTQPSEEKRFEAVDYYGGDGDWGNEQGDDVVDVTVSGALCPSVVNGEPDTDVTVDGAPCVTPSPNHPQNPTMKEVCPSKLHVGAGVSAGGSLGSDGRCTGAARSSAYLLHLAEMCHAVLHDERWKGMLSWEVGDDLSGALTLAKFDVPEQTEGEVGGGKLGLDGDNDEGGTEKRSGTEARSGKYFSAFGKVFVDGIAPGAEMRTKEEGGENECNKEDLDEDEDGDGDGDGDLLARAMLLYSRMFVRKGPWFRLDDLFKYYSHPWSRGMSSGGVGCDIDDTDCPGAAEFAAPNANATEQTTPKVVVSKLGGGSSLRWSTSGVGDGEEFCEKVGSATEAVAGVDRLGGNVGDDEDRMSEDGPVSSKAGRTRSTIDEDDKIHCAELDSTLSSAHTLPTPQRKPPMSALRRSRHDDLEDPLHALLTDVRRLLAMGLVRTFRDEEECGIIAGNRKMTAGILSTKERDCVLCKLGGGGFKRQRKIAGNKNAGRGRGRGRGCGSGRGQGENVSSFRRPDVAWGEEDHHRNLIVRQMKCQRTIFCRRGVGGGKESGGVKRHFLPVRRHVENVLFDCLARKYFDHHHHRGRQQVGDITTKQHWTGNRGTLNEIRAFSRLCWATEGVRHGRTDGNVVDSDNPPMCIRLREKPLASVRRCCRLYLIAGGGAGQMRNEGWLSVKEPVILPDDSGNSRAPKFFSSNVTSWHRVRYSGLQHRLKLKSYDFTRHYRRKDQQDGAQRNLFEHGGRRHSAALSCKVFETRDEFHAWEDAVELRAALDVLVETIARCQMTAKRKKKSSSSPPVRCEVTGAGHEAGHGHRNGSDDNATAESISFGDDDSELNDVDDVFHVLTPMGRRTIIARFLVSGRLVDRICERVDRMLRSLIDVEVDLDVDVETTLVPKPKLAASSCWDQMEEVQGQDRFDNMAERIMCALVIVASEVLRVRVTLLENDDVRPFIQRPWLRHLRAEAVLAYCVWDGIELLEKKKYYHVAVPMLETILGIPNGRRHGNKSFIRRAFTTLLLSRRNRGKALERLVVDHAHLSREEAKKRTLVDHAQRGLRSCGSFPTTATKGDHCNFTRDAQLHICAEALSQVGNDCSVPFCHIRYLAKRMKQPLTLAVAHIRNEELRELRIRILGDNEINNGSACNNVCRRRATKVLQNSNHTRGDGNLKPSGESSSCGNQQLRGRGFNSQNLSGDDCEKGSSFEENSARVITGAGRGKMNQQHSTRTARRSKSKTKERVRRGGGGRGERTTGKKHCDPFQEWQPITDFSVANSMSTTGDDGFGGGRCTYVGWEDDDRRSIVRRSLNVEELALEEYASGRLPKEKVKGLGGGGWIGWHDEGGHVRALFRILCSGPILGHLASFSTPNGLDLASSIFLTPYQSSPLDLHVGHSTLTIGDDGAVAFETNTTAKEVGSFYASRRDAIDRFLETLEGLDDDGLCHLVHESISRRFLRDRRMTDQALARDARELRTLSMIAVGFGGRMLAVMFRSLCFDYRHYSGGLPDLLLARAFYCGDGANNNNDASSGEKDFVNLNSWIGEAFDSIGVRDGTILDLAKFLVDRDDEFLGCSKNGDSAFSSLKSSWRSRGKTPVHGKQSDNLNAADVPEKLDMVHQGRRVRVQCVFVEVKSANDRLDGRQEDWLNILDAIGNARVCKFRPSKRK